MIRLLLLVNILVQIFLLTKLVRKEPMIQVRGNTIKFAAGHYFIDSNGVVQCPDGTKFDMNSFKIVVGAGPTETVVHIK